MEASARHLAFHGAIVLLVGLACGAPYARAVNRGAPANTVHSWRVAHAALPIGAILMFAVAALLSALAVPITIKWLIAVALIMHSVFLCLSRRSRAIGGCRPAAWRQRNSSLRRTSSVLGHPRLPH